MELRDIETFLTVAEKLHFGRAARGLYLSPSRVSQTIRNLEREIGGPLFVRTTRRVRLTPLGEQFRVRAEYGVEILRTALREAQASARSSPEGSPVGMPIRRVVAWPTSQEPDLNGGSPALFSA